MAPCGGLKLLVFLIILNFVIFINCLYVYDSPNEKLKPLLINLRDSLTGPEEFDNYLSRIPRDALSSLSPHNINPVITPLNDSHQQLMVYWVGSNVVICLARTNAAPGRSPIPSAVYISYDYGDSFLNVTNKFTVGNTYASLDRFYTHPKLPSMHVFADSENQVIFITTDNGQNLKRVKLSFYPTDISFVENDPFTYVAYDKTDPLKKLWITKDMGYTWEIAQESVKAFHIGAPPVTKSLVPNVIPLNDYKFTNDASVQLFVLREEPDGNGTIISSASLFKNKDLKVWMTGVTNFQVKGDFMFATKARVGKAGKDLFVSYKRGPFVRGVFYSEFERHHYFVADVSEGQIFVIAAHTGTVANLYTSLSMDSEKMTFSLSLERIFCYFPNSSWENSWISQLNNEAFADLHKVEGLRGIYIASYVVNTSDVTNIGPQHLLTVITFDRGGEWEKLKPPVFDDQGLPINCNASEGCSLHLSQKFNHLFPGGRAAPILSSSSAPGVIMATGTIGKSLKGRPGVFLSRDGGLTWRQILKDYYLFNFGDHGGVLVAVRFYRSTGETRELLYSTDEGENWASLDLNVAYDLRVYGLMTEPGFNTTVFTLFGSLPGEHQWMILKVDLKPAFKRDCNDSDYKFWSPHSQNGSRVACVLGRKEIMQRRTAMSNCYNGRDYDRPIRIEVCECNVEDFECDAGFEPNHANHQCFRDKKVGPSPYDVPKICPPGTFYNRTKGYRKIPGDVCIGGHESLYLPDQIPCPIKSALSNEFLLASQRDRIISVDLKNLSLEVLPITKLKNVIAIEFDLKNNCLYWADIILDIIGRQCFNDGKSTPEILVDTDLYSIEGMALDWMSNNLYFVDGMVAKISLIRTDLNKAAQMRKDILDKRTLTKPRGIAVHPKEGYLFWTDWSNTNPSVSRSFLDGSNVKALFKQPLVEWPNGLTIDHIAERLYWVDARLDYVGSSDLEGKQFRRIIDHQDTVSHPFAVAVFKDDMYWDDWKRNSIFAADKDHGVDVRTIVGTLPGLMDLKIFAHSVQEGTNACSNNTNHCSHICVGLPGQKSACLCPQNMVPVNGTCTCPGSVSPGPNNTCPVVEASCKLNHFMCADGTCIPQVWVCDGDNDCFGGTDEMHCKPACAENMYRCPEGQCIPKTWICDHDLDCSQGSDESNCSYEECRSGQFRCANNRCIPTAWQCDGEDDCEDNSDEASCPHPQSNVTCRAGEFRCGKKCVPQSWRCDGDKDCPNAEDEQNCGNRTCEEWQFKCKNNMCIMNIWRCDGDDDCRDSSDEENCENYTTPSPAHTPVNENCVDWMFKCGGGRCIPFWWKCDGVNDCADKSDEIGCEAVTPSTHLPVPSPGPRVCLPYQFQCASGECIQQAWVCDGMKDCDKGEDEAMCSDMVACTHDQFMCRVDGSCVFLAQVCDGRKQCPDGSDEEGCNNRNKPQPIPAGPSCESGFFPCDGSSCLPMAQLCDRHQDCYDGTDELNCSTNKTYQVLSITVDPKNKNSTSLSVYWWAPKDKNVSLQYLPSISEDSYDAPWKNYSWISESSFTFTNLKPSTWYKILIYVRVMNSTKVFPPVAVTKALTESAVKSRPPTNVTVIQVSATSVKLSWVAPPNQVKNYVVGVSPPNPPWEIEVPSTETMTKIDYQFKPGATYSFWVEARSSELQNSRSEVVSLLFDASAVIESVNSLKVVSTTNTSVTLSWQPLVNIQCYTIRITVPEHFPRIPSINTTDTSITVNNLAPGTYYTFVVFGVRMGLVGPESSIFVPTTGNKLSYPSGIKVDLREDNSVHISWAMYSVSWLKQKVDWVYGIYYAPTLEDLFSEAKQTSRDLSATTPALTPCTSYLFAVGVVGPYGSGPLSEPMIQFTKFDPRAPPIGLTVSQQGTNETIMIINWEASCAVVTKPVQYEILITETHHNRTSSITLSPTTERYMQHKISSHFGGQYLISIRTTAKGARAHPQILYTAPPIPPPREVYVQRDANGTHLVRWWEPVNLPEILTKSGYCYVVLLSEGHLNSTVTKEFRVLNPPLALDGMTPGVSYSLAVKFVTADGYESDLSSVASFEVLGHPNDIVLSTSNAVAITVVCSILFIGLAGAVAFFAIKNRRIQTTFNNVVNSHYSRRSGCTTLGSDDDDPPIITRFSDDEPLVRA